MNISMNPAMIAALVGRFAVEHRRDDLTSAAQDLDQARATKEGQKERIHAAKDELEAKQREIEDWDGEDIARDFVNLFSDEKGNLVEEARGAASSVEQKQREIAALQRNIDEIYRSAKDSLESFKDSEDVQDELRQQIDSLVSLA